MGIIKSSKKKASKVFPVIKTVTIFILSLIFSYLLISDIGFFLLIIYNYGNCIVGLLGLLYVFISPIIFISFAIGIFLILRKQNGKILIFVLVIGVFLLLVYYQVENLNG